MKKTFAILMALMMALGLLAGCGQTAEPAADEGGDAAPASYKIGVIPYYARDDFYKDLETGVRNKAAELGIELVYQDPDGDPSKEMSILEDMSAMGLDAIAVVPMGEDSVVPLLKQYVSEGTPIVTFDGKVSDPDAVSAAVQFDFAQCGVDLGKMIEKYVTETGRFDGSTKMRTAVIDLPVSVTVGVPIMDNCVKYLEDAGVIEVVSRQDGKADRNTAMGVMENILSAENGNIELLIGFNYDACMGGVQAAEAYGLTADDMVAFSQLWGTEAFEHLEKDDSMWKGGLAYSPVVMGETAVQACYDLLTGNASSKDYVCEPTFLTHDNIGSFDWQSIIAARG